MNTLRRIALFTFIVSSLLTTTEVLAVDAPVPTPAKTTSSLIPVATVNFENAKIVSQEGNTLTVSFTLTNRTGTQSGVKYGVQLVKTVNKKQSIADSHVYDESLSYTAGSSVERTITYTAPSSLSGSYTLFLTSKNESGFPFALTSVAEIKLAPTEGIEILSDTCTVATETSTTPLLKLVEVDKKQPALTCTAINHATTTTTASVATTTTLRTEYGPSVTTPALDQSISFAAGEKKAFTVSIPTATAPQIYSARISLVANEKMSNSVSLSYMIPGATATIVNATLDKDYYTERTVATLQLIWQGANIEGGTTLTTKMTNDRGNSCSNEATRPLPKNVGVISAVIYVQKDCYSPHVTVTIKSTDGAVLDTKEFDVQTTSANRPIRLPSMRTTLIIIGALIAIGFLYWFLKKRKKPMTPTAIVAIAFTAILGYGMINATAASADTFVLRNNGNALFTISMPTSFTPGSNIHVDASIQSSAVNGIGAYLQATTTGYSTNTFMSYSSIANGDTAYGSIDFAAGSPGSYNITFDAGENVLAGHYYPSTDDYWAGATSGIYGICEISFAAYRSYAAAEDAAAKGETWRATMQIGMDNGCVRTVDAVFYPGETVSYAMNYWDGAGSSDFRCSDLSYCSAEMSWGGYPRTTNIELLY